MPRGLPGWYQEAAEIMARNHCSLKAACLEIKKDLTIEECEIVERRKDFQEVLMVEEDRVFNLMAARPTRNKETAIGQLLMAINMLMKQGDYDKAATAIEKLAKLQNWTGPESNVNIFQGVTAKDIEAEKKRILAEIEQSQRSAPETLSN